MKVIVAGGSQVLDQKGFFNIGKRNYMALKKIFWKNNVLIDYENVGGNSNRTIKLTVKDDSVWLKVSGKGVIERSGFTDTDFQEVMADFGTKIQLVEDLMKSN